MDTSGSALRRRWLVVGVVLLVAAVVAVLFVQRDRSGADDATPSAAASSARGQASVPPTPAPTSESTVRRTSPAPEPSVPPPTVTGAPTVVADQPTTRKEARLSDRVTLSRGVTVAVSRVESVEGEARGPGEVAGPGLRVTVEMTNGSEKPLATDLALANLYYGASSTPADALSGPGLKPFPTSIRAGGSANGTFVFKVPKDSQEQLQIEFSYTTDAPTVIFKGSR